MTPRIQKMLAGRNDVIDYATVINKFPWLVERGNKCVISPDADGILCGLFMSHYLDWQIVGYYDNGKNLILKDGTKAADCIFLDTEIYRSNIRSIGHHISLLRNEKTLINMINYHHCLNPNTLRGRTLREKFGLKYPMGTIHLLLCIVGNKYQIDFAENSFFVILQADGTINRFLDRYSENLYEWLGYLGIKDANNALGRMITKETNLAELNEEYVSYVRKFVKGRKDKIPISVRGILQYSSFNSTKTGFSRPCIASIEDYLRFLSKETGWSFRSNKWIFDGFHLYEFTKKIVRPGVHSFNAAVRENFLSLAITKTDTMEYTIESPDILP